MVCEQIIKKFRDFDPQEHFVIAPEGLSRLYLNGFGGDVVATWMTSRDRLHEIADFSDYLSTLYEKYEAELPADCNKIVMGFSQGGTTIFRWLHRNKINVDHVLGYSCWVPEDIDLGASKTGLATKNLIWTYGLQDQFLTTERIDTVKRVMEKNKLNFKMEGYEGDHRVSSEQLKSIFIKYFSSNLV